MGIVGRVSKFWCHYLSDVSWKGNFSKLRRLIFTFLQFWAVLSICFNLVTLVMSPNVPFLPIFQDFRKERNISKDKAKKTCFFKVSGSADFFSSFGHFDDFASVFSLDFFSKYDIFLFSAKTCLTKPRFFSLSKIRQLFSNSLLSGFLCEVLKSNISNSNFVPAKVKPYQFSSLFMAMH